MSVLFIRIQQLVGIRKSDEYRLQGAEMAEVKTIDNAWLWCDEGRILDFGPMEELPKVLLEQSHEIVDADGKMIIPAFADSHTHLVFAESREKEFVLRIKGASYEDIAQSGGGILNSAAKLRHQSEDALFEDALMRLQEVITLGTGAIEIKSGYGLSTEAEVKMLRVIQKLKAFSPIPIKSTFLGAHAFPLEFRDNRKGYIDKLVNSMIPRIAEEELADYIDVFCDRGFFTTDETSAILEAGWKHGLRPKIHANELDFSGGIQVGVKYDALSVDHLEYTGEAEIEALKGTSTMPTLLPSTAFFIGLEYPPARKMIDSGLGVALASDYNPGSSPSGRMPFIWSLACIKLKMLPEEGLNALTLNSAYAMGLEEELGSITKGKLANFILTTYVPSLEFLPYSFGSDWIEEVYIEGRPFRGL